MAHHWHKFIQKKPEEVSPARELEPTAAYRLGEVIGKEGTGKGWENFPL
jgi:hypothetical protein